MCGDSALELPLREGAFQLPSPLFDRQSLPCCFVRQVEEVEGNWGAVFDQENWRGVREFNPGHTESCSEQVDDPQGCFVMGDKTAKYVGPRADEGPILRLDLLAERLLRMGGDLVLFPVRISSLIASSPFGHSLSSATTLALLHMTNLDETRDMVWMWSSIPRYQQRTRHVRQRGDSKTQLKMCEGVTTQAGLAITPTRASAGRCFWQ